MDFSHEEMRLPDGPEGGSNPEIVGMKQIASGKSSRFETHELLKLSPGNAITGESIHPPVYAITGESIHPPVQQTQQQQVQNSVDYSEFKKIDDLISGQGAQEYSDYPSPMVIQNSMLNQKVPRMKSFEGMYRSNFSN